MVSYGTEFVVEDTKKLFDEARRNAKAKHEKWAKYYNRRRRDVLIRINDWVLLQTHPLSSAVKKVVSKFKPKFEGPYRVLEVRYNNLVVWKAGRRLTVNIDQVRLYHQRKSDENGIRVGNANSSGSRYQASSFEGVRPRSNWSQNSKNSGPGERREVKGKVTGFKEDQKESSERGNNNARTKYRKVGPRRTERVESRPSSEQIKNQRGPVRSRGRRDQQYRPYYKDQGCKQRSTSQSCQETKRGRSTRNRGAQRQQCLEIGGKSTSRMSASLEVLVRDVNNTTL
ncbi:uncharacterized protein TNCV_2672091 [Trichonephila clavipes]|nr:uncharacterized protein TNCV_2672091 [Trichonephila clavipes]